MSRTLRNSVGGEIERPRADEGGRIGNAGAHGSMGMSAVEEVAMRELDFETSGEDEGRSVSGPSSGGQASVDPTSHPDADHQQAGASDHDPAAASAISTTPDSAEANVVPTSHLPTIQQQRIRLIVTRETMTKVVENAIAKAVANPNTENTDIVKLHNLLGPQRQHSVGEIAQWLEKALRDGSVVDVAGLTARLEADHVAAGLGPEEEGVVEGGVVKRAPTRKSKRRAEKDRVAAGKALAESIFEAGGGGELQIKGEYAQEWMNHLPE